MLAAVAQHKPGTFSAVTDSLVAHFARGKVSDFKSIPDKESEQRGDRTLDFDSTQFVTEGVRVATLCKLEMSTAVTKISVFILLAAN